MWTLVHKKESYLAAGAVAVGDEAVQCSKIAVTGNLPVRRANVKSKSRQASKQHHARAARLLDEVDDAAEALGLRWGRVRLSETLIKFDLCLLRVNPV